MVPAVGGNLRVATPGHACQMDAGHCFPLPPVVQRCSCQPRSVLLPVVPCTCNQDEVVVSNGCSPSLTTTCDAPCRRCVEQGSAHIRALSSEPEDALLVALSERLEQHLTAEVRARSAVVSALVERLEQRLGEQTQKLEVLVSGQERLLTLFSGQGGRRPPDALVGHTEHHGRASFHLGLKNCMREHSHGRMTKSPKELLFGSENIGRVRQLIRAVVSSDKFDFLMCFLIVLNAAFLGFQADAAARRPSQEEPEGMRLAGSLFCWIFVCELMARLLGFGSAFFLGEERWWNLFDFVIVACSTAEEIITVIARAEIPMNTAVLRLMRILKFARIIRIVRILKFFRELRIMMLSMMASVRSLLWSVALLLMVMFGFAVSLTASVAEAVAEGVVFSGDLRCNFGSLPEALLLLLQAATGGMDWSAITDDLSSVSSLSVAVFVVYIIFVSFAVMNIMTGFFVECAMTSAEADLDRVINLQAEERERTAKNLREVLQSNSGKLTDRISWQELKFHLQEPKVRAYLKTLNLEVMDLQCFFDLVASDREEHPTVNIDEFVRCCLRLKGLAKNADVVVLRYQLEKLTTLLRGEWQDPSC